MVANGVVGRLRDGFRRFAENVRLPTLCVYCDGTHIVWNGHATRTGTFRVVADGGPIAVHVDDIPIRRARCQGCRRSWRLRPPGVMPQRHYQLCVVAHGLGRLLFEPGATIIAVALAATCSSWTVGRWMRWIAGIGAPADLQARLVEIADAPVLVEGRAPVRSSRSAALRVAVQRAASVLQGIEALASAAGAATPGLGPVVEALVANRYRHTTYASPFIPEFASFKLGGRFGMLPA